MESTCWKNNEVEWRENEVLNPKNNYVNKQFVSFVHSNMWYRAEIQKINHTIEIVKNLKP